MSRRPNQPPRLRPPNLGRRMAAAGRPLGKALRRHPRRPDRRRRSALRRPPRPPRSLRPPPRWEALARLYDWLGPAAEAVDWVRSAAPKQPGRWIKNDAIPALEAAGAAASLLHRWLGRHLPGQHDAQQAAVYERLRALGQ